MNKPRTVALVGRPNVGKSRLFNRLAGRRIAIVHDQAGVTRDVNSAEIEEHYILLDTGGIGLVVDMDHQQLIQAAEEQVWFAVEAADVICFVVDGREGLTSLDETIAERLHNSGKEVILAVNKVDNVTLEDRTDEFIQLGFSEILPVSAEHGYRADDLAETIKEKVGPPPETGENPAEKRIKLAFVGRPNVGKSSLCNQLLQDERLVVSEVPGTTRDSVGLDLDFEEKDGHVSPYRLIDTAGLRRRKRVDHSIEYFSTVRSRHAIEEADIVFLVVDSVDGITRQDKALAGEIVDAGKCVALLINKWDLAIDQFRADPPKGYESIRDFRDAYAEAALKEIFFLPDSPVIFVSALRGFALERIFRTARKLWEVSGRKLPTPRVNQLLTDLTEKREPKYIKGKRFKIYYGVQVENRPFTFRLFVNRATKLEDSYRKFLQNSFIREFNLQGCPVHFELKGKEVRYAGGKKTRSK